MATGSGTGTPVEAGAVSDVTICNQALNRLGASTITALDDESTEADLCLSHYETTRDELLRSHRWGFALAWAEPEAAASEEPWEYEYDLPEDCLRVVTTDPRGTLYEIVGSVIKSDEGSLLIQYVQKVTDPNLFDATFTETLVLALAAKLCMPLMHDKVLHRELMEELAEVRARARLLNLQESVTEPTRTTWNNARL